jgi:hypothetical protein
MENDILDALEDIGWDKVEIRNHSGAVAFDP